MLIFTGQPHRTLISADISFVRRSAMELTKVEKAILAHVVVDPDAWVEHAVKTVGESAVMSKIYKWKPTYELEKAKPNYMGRVARDAAAVGAGKTDTIEIEKEALIQAKMRELAVSDLIIEGKLDNEGQVVK